MFIVSGGGVAVVLMFARHERESERASGGRGGRREPRPSGDDAVYRAWGDGERTHVIGSAWWTARDGGGEIPRASSDGIGG